jgi:two-component system sensor histidine kinase TctE
VNEKPRSLKRPLIVQPLIFQFATLFISVWIILAIATRMDSGGLYTDETIAPVIASAIVRQEDGALTVQLTPGLSELRAESPDLWFIAEDDTGRSVSFGQVPEQYASLIGTLHRLSYAHMRDRSPPYRLSAVVRREHAPAGTLTVLGHGKLTGLTLNVLIASNMFTIPVFLVLALISLIVTPWTVKRSLAGVNRIAAEAEQIDPDQHGWRLSEADVPREILPLVRAVNIVLCRLDEAYERQRRFIASAAHELRTPIAILRVKVDAAEEITTRRLASDVERLANLAEQLLDLQRMDVVRTEDDIYLGSLMRQVAGDLAPLLIASERTIEVIIEKEQRICGDAGAMERVVTNLVQNAIEHGGRHVIIRVTGSVFEVEDDGPGIPTEERERVFEPFHRLRPRSSGAGLGLSLVQQVVERHGGRVSILAATNGGTIVRIALSAR